MKREKCSFAQQDFENLGYKISGGTLRMDEAKVRVITEREPPTKVTKLRSFLGLVNYYRRFIKGYSRRAAPLTNLLKKNMGYFSSKSVHIITDLFSIFQPGRLKTRVPGGGGSV